MKKIVIYVRNKNIRPSDYYRVVQYTKGFDAEVIIRSAIPDIIDRWSLGAKQKSFSRVFERIYSRQKDTTMCNYCSKRNFSKKNAAVC